MLQGVALSQALAAWVGTPAAPVTSPCGPSSQQLIHDLRLAIEAGDTPGHAACVLGLGAAALSLPLPAALDLLIFGDRFLSRR